MQFDNVTLAELAELLNDLKASGHGEIQQHDARSGSFVVSKKVAWITVKAHGNYVLTDAGSLVVNCDHEKEVEPELVKALASIRGARA
jgi:hypothetical protein